MFLKNPVSTSCPPASEVTLTSKGMYPSVPRRFPVDAVVSNWDKTECSLNGMVLRGTAQDVIISTEILDFQLDGIKAEN